MPNKPNATTLATAYATSRSSASIAGAVETIAVTPQMLVPAAINVPSRGGKPSRRLNPTISGCGAAATAAVTFYANCLVLQPGQAVFLTTHEAPQDEYAAQADLREQLYSNLSLP